MIDLAAGGGEEQGGFGGLVFLMLFIYLRESIRERM